jgi:hypothetical protein
MITLRPLAGGIAIALGASVAYPVAAQTTDDLNGDMQAKNRAIGSTHNG